MREAGVRLGLLEEGQPIPPSMRSKLAKVVHLAEAETATAHASTERLDKLTRELVALWDRLEPIPNEPRGRIVAALAPTIWRATEAGT